MQDFDCVQRLFCFVLQNKDRNINTARAPKHRQKHTKSIEIDTANVLDTMSNIQVVVRCRGRNSREADARSPVVIDVPSAPTSTVTVQAPPAQNLHHTSQIHHSASSTSVSGASALSSDILASINSKTYTVDHAYGPQSDQQQIYENVVSPLFEEFVKGFNVTVLAYGQTGTGKTYTMCGEVPRFSRLPLPEALREQHPQSQGNMANKSQNQAQNVEKIIPVNAGVIPRVLHSLFAKLEQIRIASLAQNPSPAAAVDHVVKCLYVELYNEELRDLLADDDGASNAKLRIYEAKDQTGSGDSIMIQNLREEYIVDSYSGLRVLQRGLNKRKTASTKLNDVSSRSHTIFTISLYKNVKGDASSSGAAGLFRISKMNLVDLAGSENVSRSGAINQRAKEAGSINQSLLALGRVVNCLSDRETRKAASRALPNSAATSTNTNSSISHIPYRESKLTRLLQDSIGGHTKTVLIATISPAKVNLDETLSTLEYASRAKSIQNKPQLGQDSEMMLKKILVKDMAKEISKLASDLVASRTKNGVWMDENNHRELIGDFDVMKTDLKESRSMNEGFKIKIEQLNSKLLQHEDEIAKLKKAKESMKMLNEKAVEDMQNLKESHSQELTSILVKLKGVENLKDGLKGFLKNVVDKSIQSSIMSIDNLLAEVSENGTGIQTSAISRSLEGTIKNLLVTGESIKSQVDSTFQSDVIPKMISNELQGSLSDFKHALTEATQRINQKVHEMNDLDKSNFTNIITNGLLSNKMIDTRIDEIVEQRLSLKLKKINSDFIHKISQLSSETFQKQNNFLSDSLKEVSKEIIDNSKSNILNIYSHMSDESQKSQKHIVDSTKELVVRFDEHKHKSRDSITRVSKKISELVNGNLIEPGMQKILQTVKQDGKGIEKELTDMGEKMELRQESSMVQLRNIQNDLSNILQLARTPWSPTKSALTNASPARIPCRSPTRIPSRSPARVLSPTKALKRSSSSVGGSSIPTIQSPSKSSTEKTGSALQLSKIPQLSRTASTEKENVKRRKV